MSLFIVTIKSGIDRFMINLYNLKLYQQGEFSATKINSIYFGGARGVIVIVIGNGHGDTSSNPGRD